ncbi:molybdopterin converting factor subunit 1 [Bacillus seohaeanensis]|jgi:sulfur-carrier protein|uniref:Molybdopterin synthase sulfur carrier subunit n=1 Tax=Bacillus seohaeanensis TaxID=284580 RepID=A0ABW5RQ09_9BACI
MIKVLLFAHLQEEIGKTELQIESENMTVEELKAWINSHYSVSHLDKAMTAINEQYATDVDSIQTGDVVAFIPPVSGG